MRKAYTDHLIDRIGAPKLRCFTPTNKKTDIPVLLVHGGVQTPKGWQELVDELTARGIPCVTFALPGHGDDQPEKLRYLLNRDCLKAVRAAYRLTIDTYGNCVVFGHSMGGLFTRELMYEIGSFQPKRAVLSNSVGNGFVVPILLAYIMDPINMIKLTYRGVLHLAGGTEAFNRTLRDAPKLIRGLFIGKKASDQEVAAYTRNLLGGESFIIFLQSLLMVWYYLLKPVPKLDYPVHVIGSDADNLVPLRMVRNEAANLGVEPKIFSGLPHMMHLGDGAKVVADYLAGLVLENPES